MKFDRDKFKPISVKTLKEQQREVNKKIGFDGEGTPWLFLEPGTNRVRIYPAHPGASSWTFPLEQHWLPQEIEKDGKKEIANRTIYNSRTHGGTEKDIVEEYIKFVTEQMTAEIEDEDERKVRLLPISHWKKGIKPKTSWVMYAALIDEKGNREFGFLSLTNSTKEKLNGLAIDEESDAAITIDPFTDVNKGKVVKIYYTPEDKVFNNIYKLSFYLKDDSVVKDKLSDEELEAFAELDSLEKLFTNNYTGKDFMKALNGLRMFDEREKFGAFENDEWLKICEEIAAYYPEEDDDEKKEEKNDNKKEESKEKDGNDFDEMDRTELKFFIKKHKLPIIVKDKYDDDDLREMIQDAMKEKEESGQGEESKQEEKKSEKKNEKEAVDEDKEKAERKKRLLKLKQSLKGE